MNKFKGDETFHLILRLQMFLELTYEFILIKKRAKYAKFLITFLIRIHFVIIIIIFILIKN